MVKLAVGQMGALEAALQLNSTPVKLVITCNLLLHRVIILCACQFELINEHHYTNIHT